ncbi:ABC transporter ATP-binding protein [Nocardioides sp. Arc9.136]|uniref:ABC transporter ATP-binding protein n=1 Tax=Nocardioides sp. Arc9.136 TaxID=2996826 RepID=UPI002666C573|nr:ABC transporter ATP-binding protein [Nocardioides sp. Arc9.136]WKN48930.1 ABC transporter ATP-binding protein [Nocardioides sp. Arc9.136]
MTDLVNLDGLTVSLPTEQGRVTVIHDATMRVGPGEIVGLAGESGSGKSLTARALLGLLPEGAQVGGSIRYDGQELVGLDEATMRGIRGGEIAMVFQDSTAALHPMLTVGRQLTEHMRVHRDLSRKAARTEACDLLDRVRIPDPRAALRAYPHQFSGGMRQRIAIASALAGSPRLLIADEPTTALDVTVQAGILALLEQLRAESGLSVVFITHDLSVLSAISTRSYVFYGGRVMESGPTGEVLTQPLHPYTKALLDSRPHGISARTTLRAIPGEPVVPGQAPPGCPFEPRCSFSVDACREMVPALVPTVPGRSLACDVVSGRTARATIAASSTGSTSTSTDGTGTTSERTVAP